MARARRRLGTAGDELEAPLATLVENLLTLYGWRWYHTHDSRRSPAGFPDYVAVRGPELLFVELKSSRGRVRPAQREWLEDLEAFAGAVDEAVGIAQGAGGAYLKAGQTTDDAPTVEVLTWRPEDKDTINERLSRGRHRLEYAG